jgi:recombination protein RecR
MCIVETWHDLQAIERTHEYKGEYHVLGGAISPLHGINADDLSLGPLVQRVQQGGYQEIILALNPTFEGEATTAYVLQQLKRAPYQGTVSCLSRGMPIGASLDVMDRLTVGKAFSERKRLEQ